jgi:cation diffusion facilitator CzcD-associated flavoprotein CzcO
VDSEIPEYQLSIPETYKDWVWPSNYPDYKDLRAYFDHCDKVLGIKKETAFNSVVVDAQFNTREGKWTIKTADGRAAKAKYFVVAAGFAAKRYIPDEFVGIDDFQGIVHHSSFWPDMNIDVRGKKCAVIGTGASGVQITQAWGPVAGELKVFQRTPNLAVPMRKRSLTAKEQNDTKVFYLVWSLREGHI